MENSLSFCMIIFKSVQRKNALILYGAMFHMGFFLFNKHESFNFVSFLSFGSFFVGFVVIKRRSDWEINNCYAYMSCWNERGKKKLRLYYRKYFNSFLVLLLDSVVVIRFRLDTFSMRRCLNEMESIYSLVIYFDVRGAFEEEVKWPWPHNRTPKRYDFNIIMQ